MRKNIALMLALVMLFTMIAPMSASAASSNRVTNVLTMGEDEYTTVNDTYLVIQDDEGDIGSNSQRIQLTLDNAEWKLDGGTDAALISALTTNTIFRLDDGTDQAAGTSTLEITRQTSTRLEVNFEFDNSGPDVAEIRIPILAQVKDEGDATITVNRLQSAVSRSTDLVFATVIDGDTVTTVDGTITFGPDKAEEIEAIVIDETVPNALDDMSKMIEFKLPRDFEWSAEDDLTVTATGGLAGSGTFVQASVEDAIQGRDFKVSLADLGISSANSNETGTIVIEGLYIYSDSDRFGDVDLTVDGVLSEQTFKIAEYKDFSLSVDVDGDLAEVIAGQWENAGEETGFELPTIVIEENIEDSWVSGRKVTVDFPDWIKIVESDESVDNMNVVVNEDGVEDNTYEFTPTRDGGAMEIELDFDVIAEAGAEGDIEVVVSGRGLDDEYTVVVGTVVPPVSVDMEMVEIVIGDSAQPVGDITITENVVGALKDGELLEIAFDIPGLRIHSGYDVEVVNEEDSGLEIDDVDHDGNTLEIEIDRESDDEEGVIVISGLQVSLARTPATADYDVIVGGLAVVNNAEEDGDWFEEFAAWEAPMLRVVTDRTREVRSIDFVIGQEIPGLNVAPFIQDGRTMVPLRAMEDLLDTELRWNPTSRTVSFRYNDDAYVVAIGEQMIKMNGADWHEMDTVAIISQDRTYLPASQVADALGDVSYSWDEITRTATFTR